MRRRSKLEHAVLLLVAYLPFLASSPGRVSADSKQYLYLDPGRFLARAGDLWDPSFGAGTVPHQNLGYLFPVGPFYWLLEQVGIPDWVAQRLWWGTLGAAAALGARWLFAQLGVGRLGAFSGAVVYLLTPYQLAFTARISVLLLPWAALPWMVGLTMRATRTRDWRAPAALGLLLLLAGGINASALLLVAIAPAVWVITEVSRERRLALALSVGRIGLIAIGVSAWWLVGLRIQSAYGLPVLHLTENSRTVAEASTPGDVLRGLGNWFFYGRDRTGYSLEQADDYAGNGVGTVLSFALPALAIGAAGFLRWTYRRYFGLLIIVGIVVGVGAWPYDDPSPYGSLWQTFTTETSVGLALRNTPRVVPIVVLGIAALLASSVGALPRPRWRTAGAAVVCGLAAAAIAPVWIGGDYLSSGLSRPEQIPGYWREAIATIDAGDHGTRVLEIPGSSFAAYRWGTTVDPITPGLTDRPYLAREVLPQGTPPSANLLDAIDRRMQLGTFEPAALVPLARLLGVGTVSFRGDLDRSGRFDTPDPGPLWGTLTEPLPAGLEQPERFGRSPAGSTPDVALIDVRSPRPIVHTAPAANPMVVAGDGDGLVDIASAGLLDGAGLVQYSASLDDEELSDALDRDARLVVTDSNRRRIQTWFYALRDTRGPTEEAGRAAPDPTGYDFRLDPFGNRGDAARTVVEQVGGQVSASAEGGPERPEERAAKAVDGLEHTAWRVSGPLAIGASITLRLDEPVMTDSIELRQPDGAPGDAAIGRVRVVVNGDASVEVDLGSESFEGGGQRVSFPPQRVREVRVEIVALAAGDPARVGLAELTLGDVRVTEVVRPPTDLLDRVGADLSGHRLDIVLTRLRHDIPGSDRGDDEERLVRRVDVPLARSFAVRGVAGVDLSGSGGCDDSLLRVDGEPYGMKLVPSAGRSDGAALEGCEPLDLAPGSHLIEATPGAPAGVDRLTLSTSAEGLPVGMGSPPPPPGSSVESVRRDNAHAQVEVSSDGEPFWLVLGESHSEGWNARSDGAKIGELALVDGYANGWLIDPDGAGMLQIDLRWDPQRLLWPATLLSLATALACVVLVLRPRRAHSASALGLLAAAPGMAAPSGSLSPARSLLAASFAGGVALLVAAPAVAVLTALAAIVIARLPRVGLLVLVAAQAGPLVAHLADRPSAGWLAVTVLGAHLLVSATRSPAPAGPPARDAMPARQQLGRTGRPREA